VDYPTHISGTWQFSGDWLGHYKFVATDQDLGDPIAVTRDLVCPVCEYPEAIHLSKHHSRYPLLYWCPACQSVWAWYIAKCPDCGFFVWKKDQPAGMVVCSGCGMQMEQSYAEELNEDPNFGLEYMEEPGA